MKTLAHTVLRESARDGRPIPSGSLLHAAERTLGPVASETGTTMNEGLAKLGIEINERELVTA